MDANGEGWNYPERELKRGVSVPGGPTHAAQNPLVFPSGTCLSRVLRANRLGKSVGRCSGGLMDQDTSPASKLSRRRCSVPQR
jgi:hypothetical protein